MARIGLNDVSALPDPLLSYQFTLLVPNIPGQGSGQGLAIRCKTSSLPGSSLDDVDVTLHGVTLKFAGRPMFSHSQQATFVETRDMYVRDAVRKWTDFARDIRNGSGNFAATYKANVLMQVFDDTNAIIRTIKLVGCFPQSFDDVSMDGSSSTAVEPSVTFSYDLWSDE